MKTSFASNFLAVVEIRTKLVSVSTLLLALAYVTWRRGFPDILPLVLMWAATLAVDMGTTAFNNYFDYLRGTDGHRDINESDKVLIHSGVEPGFALASALFCFVSAIILGLALALSGHPWVIPAGAASMAVGFLYTGGPRPISRTPFGEFFAGGCLGFGLFAIACGVWGQSLDAGVLVASLPSTLWIAAILTVNNTCDIVGDRAAGRRTLSILLGPGGGEVVIILLGAGAQTVGILAAVYGILPWLAAPALALSCLPLAAIFAGMHRSGFSHATKGSHMRSILKALILSTAAGLVGYLPLFQGSFRFAQS